MTSNLPDNDHEFVNARKEKHFPMDEIQMEIVSIQIECVDQASRIDNSVFRVSKVFGRACAGADDLISIQLVVLIENSRQIIQRNVKREKKQNFRMKTRTEFF